MYNSTTDNTNNSQQEYEQQQQQTYTYQPVDNYNSNVNTNPQYFNYSTYYDASSQYQPTSLNNYNQTYYHICHNISINHITNNLFKNNFNISIIIHIGLYL